MSPEKDSTDRTPDEIDLEAILARNRQLAEQAELFIAKLPDELKHDRSDEEWIDVYSKVWDALSIQVDRNYTSEQVASFIELLQKNVDKSLTNNADADLEIHKLRKKIVHSVSIILNHSNLLQDDQIAELQKLDTSGQLRIGFLLRTKYHHLPDSAFKVVEDIALNEEFLPTVWIDDEVTFPLSINFETPDGKIQLARNTKLFFGHFKGGGQTVHFNDEEARQMEPIMSLVLYTAAIDLLAIIQDLKQKSAIYQNGLIIGVTPNQNLVELCKKQLGFKQVINIEKLFRDNFFNLNVLRAGDLKTTQKKLFTLLAFPQANVAETIVVSIADLIKKEEELKKLTAGLDRRISRDHPELAAILHTR